jgi:adenylate cyclase
LGLDLCAALPIAELLVLFPTVLGYRYLTEEREKRNIRLAFRYYLTPSVMDAVLADPSLLKLGGEKRELTVLFSDIRGFTSLSEKLAPEQLVHMLNDYLTPMTDVVFENGGTLDKYMGDAIMAFYGAPLEQPDHALRAVKTADSMMRALATLAPEWRAEGLPTLDIGIGINSGPMVVGNMGSESRFDYTVMGDAVNLGSRLEGTNKVYGTHVILSEDTEALVRGQVTTRELDSVRVKGKHKPVRIYELISIGSPPPEWVEALEEYRRGLSLYRQRDFEQAAASFERVLERRPGDKPAEMYVRRCRDLQATPPALDWDGVLDLLTK